MAMNSPPDREPAAEAASTESSSPPQEQLLYARWLATGVNVGMAVTLIAFVGYVTGWLPSAVPAAELSRWWGMPLQTYLQQSGAPTGWGWLARLGQGDATALAGIALLATCSVPALLALLPGAWARRDRVLVAVALAQAVVILAAASGWLTGGH